MSFLAIIGIALISVSFIVILRKNAPEFAVPVSVIATLIILVICITLASDVFEKIEKIAKNSSISAENIKIIFKALGVCYITQVGKDVCNDCGETALGDKVDLVGKITVAAMSLGLITQVIKIITELIGI